MEAEQTLRIGARMNATLSLAVGGLLSAAPAIVGDRLGVEILPWLRALGIGLLAHAGLLEWAVRRNRPERWIRLNVAMVAPYPLVMLALAVTVIEPTAGKAILLVDGACVAMVAAVQWSGLRRHAGQSSGAAATLTA